MKGIIYIEKVNYWYYIKVRINKLTGLEMFEDEKLFFSIFLFFNIGSVG
jgi:hypothetical protein